MLAMSSAAPTAYPDQSMSDAVGVFLVLASHAVLEQLLTLSIYVALADDRLVDAVVGPSTLQAQWRQAQDPQQNQTLPHMGVCGCAGSIVLMAVSWPRQKHVWSVRCRGCGVHDTIAHTLITTLSAGLRYSLAS